MNNHLKKIALALAIALVLSACGSKWNVKVDLKPEEAKALQTKIQETKVAIRDFQGKLPDFPSDEIVVLAESYAKLGNMKEAIGTYKKWIDDGHKTKAMINNIGRLYDRVGETELAVKQYQRLVDEYLDTSYLYDITWSYIKAAQATKGKQALDFRKKAEKYFNAWQLDQHTTDNQTQEAIKGLREKEAKKPTE